MRRVACALAGAGLLCGAAAAQGGERAMPRGSWAGIVVAGEDEVGLRLRFDDGAARFSVPAFGWYDLAARVGADDETVIVELDVYGDRAGLELDRVDGELTGSWRGWGVGGEVRLGPSSAPQPTTHAVPFENEGRAFEGLLLLPPGEGPFPAIVWTHGSGRIDREDPIYRSLAAWVVDHGIASLVYDKRPPEPGATMQVLGRDAASAARALAGDARIAADRIGVGGMSQGGWVAPIAAAGSDAVRFVVGLSAPGVSPGEQNIFNQEGKVRAAGFGEEDAKEATRILRAIYAYLRTGEGRDDVWRELEGSCAHPWFESAYELAIWHRQGLPPAPWEHREALDFDPGTVWTEVRVPAVCVWGAADTVVPPEVSRERIAEWTSAAARELVIVDRADHSLRLPPRGAWSMGAWPLEAHVVPRFVRGLGETAPDYPPAPRGEDVHELHGETVADPYRAFERLDEATEAWARRQDELTAGMFADDPRVEAFRVRIAELNEYARAPVPRVAGARWFTEGQRAGQNLTDVRVQTEEERRAGEAPRMLVDPEAHPASPEAPVALGPPVPDPFGRYVLYAASSAALADCVRVVDVETGSDLAADAVPMRYWPWRVSWMADGEAFVYVQGSTVRVHRLGDPVAEDPVLFRASGSPLPELAVLATADGTSVVVTAFHPDDDTSRVFVHELGPDTDSGDASWRELLAGRGANQIVVGKRGGWLFVYTNEGAPNGRVLAVDLEDVSGEAREVVSEQPEAIYDHNHPMRPTVGLFGDRLAVLYAREGRLLLRAFDLDGDLLHEIEHAEVGFDESGLQGHADVPVVRYDCQGTFDPGTAHQVDLVTGERTVLGRAQVPFDPAAFEVERRTYTSSDGTRVPITLAHREGLVRDGSHPTLVVNWAAGGLNVRPLFLPQFHAWIERGGVLAIPAVRGSGEYGEAWHRAGVGREKGTAVADFAAAAEWLAASGFSRPGRIGLFGSSMTGAATAAVLVRHPEAFAAGLLQIPRIDLLATRSWVEEYGDFEDAGDFQAMRGWIPYPCDRPAHYPAVLVQVGSVDTVAPPWHGYKLVAALQTLQQAPDPIFLQVLPGVGHSQGTGVPRISRTLSLQYAFLARELGL